MAGIIPREAKKIIMQTILVSSDDKASDNNDGPHTAVKTVQYKEIVRAYVKKNTWYKKSI